MSPDRVVSEQIIVKRKRPKWPLFTALLIGFFVGSVFDSTLHRNYITFEIAKSNTRVNVLPKKHDVINWVSEAVYPAVPDNESVTFQSYSPCTQGGSLSRCEINGVSGRYEYLCDPPHPCLDPGVDAGSTTGPGFSRKTSNPLSAFAHNLLAPFEDFAILFSDLATTSSADEKPYGGKSKTHGQNSSVSCDSGIIKVTDEPIFATYGDVISWTAGPSTNTFSITTNPAATCSTDSVTSSTSNPYCKIVKDQAQAGRYSVPYTITGVGGLLKNCKDTTPHSITIYPPVTPNPESNP